MSTSKQTAANRRNSQKSTGPRTPEGKTASRANSLKTGLYARSQIIAGEDPAELRALADRYFLTCEPATPAESFLVDTLIDSEWLLRRYSLADAQIWDYQGADDSVRDNPNGMGLNFIRCREYFPLLQRRIDSAQRSWHRALRDLERLQTKRRAAPPPTAEPVADPPPEVKANSGQPQSAQQQDGFVPSFSLTLDSVRPDLPAPTAPAPDTRPLAPDLPPPVVHANSAQPRSAQQQNGFVPSFSQAPDSARPGMPVPTRPPAPPTPDAPRPASSVPGPCGNFPVS